jgi:preprotein translocase subunit SecA
VYSFRNELLFAEKPIQIGEEVLDTVARGLVGDKGALTTQFPVSFEESDTEKEIVEKVLAGFQKKVLFQRQMLSSFRPELNEPEKAQNVLHEVIRNLMVRKIDQLWQEHLLHIDHLRSDVHMRTVGQKDPLLEFKHESFALFEAFSVQLRREIGTDLFRFEMMPQKPASKRIPTLIQGA